MKINFCITSAVILLRTILMQLSYGMQQHLLQPLNGSQLCEYSEQQDLERFYLQITSKLQQYTINKQIKLQQQQSFSFDSAEAAIQKQSSQLKETTERLQQAAQLIFTACI